MSYVGTVSSVDEVSNLCVCVCVCVCVTLVQNESVSSMSGEC